MGLGQNGELGDEFREKPLLLSRQEKVLVTCRVTMTALWKVDPEGISDSCCWWLGCGSVG